MSRENIIEAPHGAKYLGDFMTELPNGILNKVDTGCGATTLALTNAKNTVICCPSKQLIINKVSQFPDEQLHCDYHVLGVMEGVYEKQIQEYVDSCRAHGQPIKIMVTYESFHRVKPFIDLQTDNWRVVIDEYHELLKDYSYRDKAIRKLLKDVQGIQNVTYISATPIPFGFIPNEFRDLDTYKIEWKDTYRCKPIRYKSNKPLLVAKNMILAHKAGNGYEADGVKAQEYYFFVNSVTAIEYIIREAGLTNNEVKVICSDSDSNRKTLGGIKISNISDPNKPYTFCTSTVFYGTDFYSDSGLIIIVSDGWNRNTNLDISTDILQIAGRIRNESNPFRNIIYHIFNTSCSKMTREKLDGYLRDKTKFAQDTIQFFNKCSDDEKKIISKRINMRDEHEFTVYDEDTNTVSVNEMKANYLLYRFETVDNVYKNGVSIRAAYAKAGMDVSEALHWEYVAEEYLNRISRPNFSFKSAFLEYFEGKETSFFHISPRAKQIADKYPTIPKIVQYLTPEEVQSNGYNISYVNNLLYSRLPEVKQVIQNELVKVISVGGTYSKKNIKEIFKRIYDTLMIKIAPKSTTINQYYRVEEVKIPVNSTRVDGYRILGKCFLLFHTSSFSTYKQSA